MKILVVHNYYQNPGGEDTAYQQEIDLLRRNGHQVITYERSNTEIKEMGLAGRVTLPFQTIWSSKSRKEISAILNKHSPDLAHFHNTHLMISPSAYYACRAASLPVVQSLDNPRLLCPAASFFRDGHLCEDCLNKTPPWPGVVHACYRGSRTQTAVVAAMLTTHRLLRTWQECVDVFLVATQFYKNKFIQGGLPAEKLLVKPHFIDPDPSPRGQEDGAYALYIGRLEPEKGIPTLLNAWKQTQAIPLRLRGQGPMEQQVRTAALKHPYISIVDRLSRQELFKLIKAARFLVWPSEGYYETFGFVAAEAFACGVPVIAARSGAMEEMVTHGKTGLLFIQGDAGDLAAKATWAWEHSCEVSAMGLAARREYEKKYTAVANYELLMAAYERAIKPQKSTALP
ncbi:MAG: glycosyltransferase family 4 protein [Anaerolineales bacterium]